MCQEVFLGSTYLHFLTFREAQRAQICIDGSAAPLLGRAEGQPPEPEGSPRKARGVDGESACRATMVSGPLRCKM
jgi:hypothetical protein